MRLPVTARPHAPTGLLHGTFVVVATVEATDGISVSSTPVSAVGAANAADGETITWTKYPR